MEDKFDFDQVGKRMPYTVPDDLFARLQRRVVQQAQEEASARRSRRRWAWLMGLVPTAVAAAVVALLLVVPDGAPRGDGSDQDLYSQVEQAFESLSDEDRAYIVGTYQNDLFLEQ